MFVMTGMKYHFSMVGNYNIHTTNVLKWLILKRIETADLGL